MRTANAVRGGMDAATTRCGGSAGLACGYYIFAAMRLMSRRMPLWLPLRGRSGDRPYRDCAYPTPLRAAAVWALWGSPLQGLRVSFDGGGCRSEGALGIAPIGIARILRRWGLPLRGRSGDRPYRDCAYPSTVGAAAPRALRGSPLQGLRVSFDGGGADAMRAQKIATRRYLPADFRHLRSLLPL
jgi:hypothetical protein